jgi:hypothetical protein
MNGLVKDREFCSCVLFLPFSAYTLNYLGVDKFMIGHKYVYFILFLTYICISLQGSQNTIDAKPNQIKCLVLFPIFSVFPVVKTDTIR